MKDYLLTVKIRFNAIDDAEARQKMKQKFVELGIDVEKIPEGTELKYQRVNKDGPPDGLQI